ncbi:MAG TPA: HlyD family type I secretion periplasmic adaptor subunit [Gammaproteobacteria bacterium]
MRESGKNLKPEDLDYVTDANVAIIESTPRGGRALLWIVVLFFAAAVYWADRAEVDEVTRGNGKVIPSRHVQVVQNLEGGIVSAIMVKEGQLVEEGQVLVRLDATRFASSLRESVVNVFALKAKAARLFAEAENVPFKPPAEVESRHPELVKRELDLYLSRKRELESRIAIYTRQLDQRRIELSELNAKRQQLERSSELAMRELELTAPLVAEGAVSEVELLRLRRQVSDLDGELERTRLAIPRIQSTYEEAKRKIEEVELEFRNGAREALNEIESEIARLAESSEALEDRVRRTEVRSPVRGTVKQLLVKTLGGVIQPGVAIAEVVPVDDTLLVEARVPPRDIAFLHPGQDAVVKVSAYDFAIYGGLDAKLEHISADTIVDEEGDSYYQVRVRTSKAYIGPESNPLPIIPGMQAEVDILTGKKTVLTYVLKPVLRARQQAFTER